MGIGGHLRNTNVCYLTTILLKNHTRLFGPTFFCALRRLCPTTSILTNRSAAAINQPSHCEIELGTGFQSETSSVRNLFSPRLLQSETSLVQNVVNWKHRQSETLSIRNVVCPKRKNTSSVRKEIKHVVTPNLKNIPSVRI